MKNVIFKAEKQNVYIHFTGGGSRVMSELYCIAISEEIATYICNSLNYAKNNDINNYLPE